MLPFNDLYHFEMPLFWIQRHSILPFPVNDPRVVSLSFLSEALQLPGQLYLHLDRTPEVVTIVGGVLALGVIFLLARRAGASVAAAGCAAAITTGYTSFALDLFHAAAEMFLAGAFFGTSLLFLMDAYANRAKTPLPKADLGCSIFLFLMACGAKNSTTLIAPLYIVFFAWVVKACLDDARIGSGAHAVGNSDPPAGGTGRGRWTQVGTVAMLAPSILACGIAGLLCSGVAWNYVSNKLWFGQAGLPPVIRTTVSQDFHPRAIWTRICRGAVLVAYDTIWVPRSARAEYVSLCEQTVKALGGRAKLGEDDHYYSFSGEAITPQKGLGLLGIVFFIPGLIMALVQLLSGDGFGGGHLTAAAFNKTVLIGLAVGSFVMCHLVLHWQAVGLLRLMFPFVVAGAPLAAFVLERRWPRIPALALLLLSSTMFVTFWTGHISRRMGWSDRPFLKPLSRLQNNHSGTVHYQWTGQLPGEFQQREDYSFREVYAKMFEGLHQPCTLGFIGNPNQQCLELFGPSSQNRVFPLVDSRADDKVMEPPADLDYVVAVDKFSQLSDWAKLHGFEQLFSCSDAHGELVQVFGKAPLSHVLPQVSRPAEVSPKGTEERSPGTASTTTSQPTRVAP
jgi:hypothetical protein